MKYTAYEMARYHRYKSTEYEVECLREERAFDFNGEETIERIDWEIEMYERHIYTTKLELAKSLNGRGISFMEFIRDMENEGKAVVGE